MEKKQYKKGKVSRNAEIEKQAMQNASRPAFLQDTLSAILCATDVEEMRQLTARAACVFSTEGTQFILDGLFAFIAGQNKALKGEILQEVSTISPEAIISAYAKKFGIPVKDVYLHIHLDGNSLYEDHGVSDCTFSDWLVNEGILTGSKNQIEVIPMYWIRENDEARIEKIRG